MTGTIEAGVSRSARRRRGLSVLPVVGLYAAVFATRIPLLWHGGLGTDPDAWRLYLAGGIDRAGTYAPSRTPGYPVVELVGMLLQGAPWWLLCAFTAASSTVGIVAAAVLARDLGTRWWPLVGLGAGLTSIVWRTSATFMDYGWAMGALLVSMLLAHRRHHVWAGLALGLALACRPSTALAATVFLGLFAMDRWWTSRRIAACLGAGFAVVGAFFAIPVATYGASLANVTGTKVSPQQLADMLMVGTFGRLGAVAVALAAAIAALHFARRRAALTPPVRAWLVASVLSCLVQVAAFVLLPVDAGYLVPAVVMLWLVAALTLNRSLLLALAVAVPVSALLPAGDTASVIYEAHNRRVGMEEAAADVRAIQALPPGAVVVAGFQFPQVIAIADGAAKAQVHPLGPQARIILRGGQVLVYVLPEHGGQPAPAYRLRRAPGDLPVLTQ